MPFAVNPLDGCRIYFEDNGGSGEPLVLTYGLMDPIDAARSLKVAHALEERFRVIYPDHRGHGRSDKPHDKQSYAMPLRVADILAVLDQLGLDTVRYVGVSWGARLGFALGEHAPGRFSSLALIGNQPLAWNRAWSIVSGLTAGLVKAAEQGMPSLVQWYEDSLGQPLREPERTWLIDNDPVAISAAWAAALEEGPLISHLSDWRVPCLIIAGQRDEMHDNAERAAAEMPGARFLSLPGLDHLQSLDATEIYLPDLLDFLR
jgi:pimeloyl-ACP methyl ester carboxylesterase